MTKKITLTKKRVWGKIRYYPSCEMSETFCQVLGQPTITLDVINVLNSRGWIVEILSSC